jgi:hypothetical protein
MIVDALKILKLSRIFEKESLKNFAEAQEKHPFVKTNDEYIDQAQKIIEHYTNAITWLKKYRDTLLVLIVNKSINKNKLNNTISNFIIDNQVFKKMINNTNKNKADLTTLIMQLKSLDSVKQQSLAQKIYEDITEHKNEAERNYKGNLLFFYENRPQEMEIEEPPRINIQ